MKISLAELEEMHSLLLDGKFFRYNCEGGSASYWKNNMNKAEDCIVLIDELAAAAR